MNNNISAFALVKEGMRDQQIMITEKKHVGFYPHPSVVEKFTEQLVKYRLEQLNK